MSATLVNSVAAAVQDAAGIGVRAQVGAVLAATSLALAPLCVFLVRRIFPGRNVVFARWGFSHLALLVLLIASLLFLRAQFWPERVGDLAFELSSGAVVFALAAGLVASFAHRLEPAGWRSLGLWPGRNLRACAAGLVAYAVLLPGIVGVGFMWPWILRVAGVEYQRNEMLDRFADLDPEQLRWMLVLAIGVLPLLEELLFRVFLQPLLVQNFSERGGILITSCVFAALHGVESFLPIFALSMLLGGIMLRTQRLAAVWLVHGAHNALMLWLYLAQHEAGAQSPFYFVPHY